MKFRFICTWTGCNKVASSKRGVTTFRCKLHQRMAELMAKNAAKKAPK